MRPAGPLLLALTTDFTDTASPLLTKLVAMRNSSRTASSMAAFSASLTINWLTSSTCWLVVAFAFVILVQKLPPDVVVCRKPLLSDVENVQPARMLTPVASIGSAQRLTV